MSEVTTPHGKLRCIGDGKTWELLCPGCSRWGELDDDQLHGRISVDHSGARVHIGGGEWVVCDYHETHDFAAAILAIEPHDHLHPEVRRSLGASDA